MTITAFHCWDGVYLGARMGTKAPNYCNCCVFVKVRQGHIAWERMINLLFKFCYFVVWHVLSVHCPKTHIQTRNRQTHMPFQLTHTCYHSHSNLYNTSLCFKTHTHTALLYLQYSLRACCCLWLNSRNI